eukprot:2263337-Pyramimonas_sp.AAC.1
MRGREAPRDDAVLGVQAVTRQAVQYEGAPPAEGADDHAQRMQGELLSAAQANQNIVRDFLEGLGQ